VGRHRADDLDFIGQNADSGCHLGITLKMAVFRGATWTGGISGEPP